MIRINGYAVGQKLRAARRLWFHICLNGYTVSQKLRAAHSDMYKWIYGKSEIPRSTRVLVQ